MERRQFTREFKLEAVRLIKERGVSYAQASADLGVHPTQLRNWVKQLADDRVSPRSPRRSWPALRRRDERYRQSFRPFSKGSKLDADTGSNLNADRAASISSVVSRKTLKTPV